MSSKLSERDYYKHEFCATVMFIANEVGIPLKQAFITCYEKAKQIRLKHGFSPIDESAWRQFKRYIKANNLDTKINL